MSASDNAPHPQHCRPSATSGTLSIKRMWSCGRYREDITRAPGISGLTNLSPAMVGLLPVLLLLLALHRHTALPCEVRSTI
jgi:hypothetical protein